MLWALLAILGVPIWLIVGMLIAIVLSRRSFMRQPGVIAIATRPDATHTWPRRPSPARVVRGVLVLTSGAALVRTEIRAIDEVSTLDIGEGPKRLADAVGRHLRFADGTSCDVALAAGDVAVLDDLPSVVPAQPGGSPPGAAATSG